MSPPHLVSPCPPVSHCHPVSPGRVPTQKQSRVPVTVAPEEVLAGSGCVGADCLLRVLANYSRSQEVKTAITVGVVGERGFRTPPSVWGSL